MTVLCSGKETQFTHIYGKKVVDSANNGTENTEEPTKSLTVSMPLAMFKRAITQRGLSVLKFVKEFNTNLPALNFLWSDVPFLSVPAKKIIEMSLLLLTLEFLK